MSDDAASTKAPATRAAVLVPVLTRQARRDGETVHSPEERVTEVSGLAEAIDLDVQTADVVRVPNARPATLFGTGKVDEIAASVQAGEIGLVVVDHPITPIQQRNLELAWKTKVLDRTGLILEIFGRRAETREGRLQVELAHLTYQRGRLVRSWTHLERQRGGFGFLGGPGETQIETDRRLIQERITRIRGELETVVKTRALHRSGRAKVPYPVVALVGYTNAGKSTLFNTLTGADVFAKDQVFATLDPTMRELALSSGRRVILSDTVGFISNLPTMLVAAFRATLEEVVNADVILHVRDIAHAETEAQKADVVDVLADLGLDPHHADAPIIEVLNKSDQLSGEDRAVLDERVARTEARAVLVSALKGDGLDALLSLIDDRVSADTVERTVSLRPEDGALMSWVFENAHVVTRETDENGSTTLQIRLDPQRSAQLDAKLNG